MEGWERLEKRGVGAFNYEVWYNQAEDRFWLKLFVYGRLIELSGDYETLNRKLDEFSRMWNQMVDTVDAIHRHMGKPKRTRSPSP